MVQEAEYPYEIMPERCNGCVVCLKACPVKAIRLRDHRAVILHDLCVDCGICHQLCPNNAVYHASQPFDAIKAFPKPVAIPSVTLFSQFDYDITPNQVLLALRQIGFAEVLDLSWLCEWTNEAVERYLLGHPELRPGISANCPVVVQLIEKYYPGLIPNLIPFLPPRLAAARWCKTKLAQRKGWLPEEVGVFYISPCGARNISMDSPRYVEHNYVDGMLCFHDVYGPIIRALGEIEETEIIQKCSGVGLAWSMSGGHAAGVNVKHTLAVAGFEEVLKILEMLDAGRLKDLRFLEPMVCPDGCLGGTLAVENRFRAKSITRWLVRRHGSKSKVDPKRIKRVIEEGYFDWEVAPTPHPLPPLDPLPEKAIAKLKRVDEIVASLAGGQCGACGAPDCQTFAEDVVRGLASLSDCPVPRKPGYSCDGAEKKQMKIREIVEQLNLEVAAGAKGLDREATTGYMGDMLSNVMAQAPPAAIWLTVQNHPNLVAVAVLRDLAAVCMVGGRTPLEETKSKADEEGIPLLLSSEDAFTLAGRLHALKLGGVG
jgi:iron only hydrogenase large subunit-like protein